MQFDLSTVETAPMVFIGTLVFGAILAAFVLAASILSPLALAADWRLARQLTQAAGLVALVLLGAGKLTWTVRATTLLAVVHGINAGWDRLVHRAAAVDMSGDFQGQTPPSTGTYPRVILSDS